MAYSPTGSTALISLRDLLDIIFRRKLQILGTLGSIVLVGIVLTLAMTPKFEAQSRILIKLGRENLYIPTISQGAPPAILPSNREEQINSELQILTSRFLADKVAQEIGPTVLYPALAPRKPGILARLKAFLFPAKVKVDSAEIARQAAISTFMRSLKVSAPPRSSVISVSFRHPDPNMAAHALEILDKHFLEQHLLVYQNSATYRFFDEQAGKLAEQLRNAEDALKDFKNRSGASAPERQRELMLTQIYKLQDELNASRADETQSAALATLHQQQLQGTSKTVTLDEQSDFNPQSLEVLQARLVDLELKARELGDRAPQDNLQEQIKMTRDRLQTEENKRFTKSRVGLNDVYQSLQKDMLKNEATAQSLNAKSDLLNKQLEELGTKLNDLNTQEVEFSTLMENVENLRQIYRLYITKREESRVSDAMDAERIANVSIIDPPTAPLKAVSPNKRLNLALSLIAGLMAGLAVAFVAEYLDNTVYRAEQVEQALGIRTLDSVPVLTWSEFPDVPIRDTHDIEDQLGLTLLGTVPRLA